MRWYCSIVLSALLAFSIGQSDKNNNRVGKEVERNQREEFDYLPTSTTGQVIEHKHYTLSYSEEYEQAEWVAYELTKDDVKGDIERTDDFRKDPQVTTESAK
jgi:endonuclease G